MLLAWTASSRSILTKAGIVGILLASFVGWTTRSFSRKNW